MRLNFYESLAARLLESVAEENVANLEQHLQQIQDMLKAGEAIEVDVLRVQVQLNTARSQKINAEDEVIISQQHLAQALGKMTETRTPSGNLPIPDGSISNRIETMSKEEKDRFEGRADLQAQHLITGFLPLQSLETINFTIIPISMSRVALPSNPLINMGSSSSGLSLTDYSLTRARKKPQLNPFVR